MAEYGLTKSGINIKRLDVILEEMQTSLSDKWGINVQQNPNSFLNVLLTDIADKFAELWELGADVYYSQYPFSAEGIYLDGTGQYIGIWREEAAPSYYRILCTGIEGTVIPSDAVISSDTNPVVYLLPLNECTISRSEFNTLLVKVVSIDGNAAVIMLNGESASYTPQSGDTESDILEALAERIPEGFTAQIDEETGYLAITAADSTSINSAILSDNLTTENVGCVFTYATKDMGDIYLPEGSINKIVKSVTGLQSVQNVGAYIAGRDRQTDEEFRDDYSDKIFSHAAAMAESIKSAILTNCQGVTTVRVYENSSDSVDEAGRYPHSIEVVCNGGDPTEIAEQILNTKAGGISTYGSVAVNVTTNDGDEVTIRFNRPSNIKTWFHVELTVAQGETLPTDYADIIRGIITSEMAGIESGGTVNPQSMFVSRIHQNVSGIAYVDITMGTGDSEPAEYDLRILYTTARERAVTENSMIEVVIDE